MVRTEKCWSCFYFEPFAEICLRAKGGCYFRRINEELRLVLIYKYGYNPESLRKIGRYYVWSISLISPVKAGKDVALATSPDQR
ncbi:hypothetical protein DRN43_00595 [Thermococci archaeon]|nr:MAG: hypothetical protein DRN43_00595 [Thermococci archaeon]